MTDIDWKEIAQIVHKHSRRAGLKPEDRDRLEDISLKLEEVGENYDKQEGEIERLKGIIGRNKDKFIEVQDGAKSWRTRALAAERKLQSSAANPNMDDIMSMFGGLGKK